MKTNNTQQTGVTFEKEVVRAKSNLARTPRPAGNTQRTKPSNPEIINASVIRSFFFRKAFYRHLFLYRARERECLGDLPVSMTPCSLIREELWK